MSMDSLLIILFLFAFFLFNSVPCSASKLSYKDHCASFVPESTPNGLRIFSFPLGQSKTGYYSGGDRIAFDSSGKQNSIYLQTTNITATHVAGLCKYEGVITFIRRNLQHYKPQRANSSTIWLDGFWSESSGKLCMVGTGTGFSKQGNLLHLAAVLKLYNVFNSSALISDLISESLESLASQNDVNYFEPVSVYMLPKLNYQYTLDTIEANDEFSAEEGPSLNSFLFCSEPFSSAIKSLRLVYSSDCNSAENCNPFNRIIGYLPSFIYFYEFDCSVPNKSLRVMLGFYNNIYDYYRQSFGFNPKEMLIGEGRWDEKKNKLCVVACHFMGITEPLGSAHVGDCSVRLSLRIPSIGTSNIVGQIWSNKTVNDSGYFKKITFRDNENLVGNIPSLNYEYNQLERVRKLCPRNNPVMNQGKRYPDAYSYDMLRFEMNVRDSNGLVGFGYSSPLFVKDHFYGQDLFAAFPSHPSLSFSVPYANNNGGIFHISYSITITLLQNVTSGGGGCLFTMSSESDPTQQVIVAAEGIYDAETGTLCMVGCGKLYSKNEIPKVDSTDCEILVKFQLPPLDAENGVYIEGSIESTRKTSDPLYFKRVEVSTAYNWKETERLLKRGLLDCFLEISKRFGREVVCRKRGTY